MQGSKTANLLEQKRLGNRSVPAISDAIGTCPIQRAYYSLKHQSTADSYTSYIFSTAQSTRATFVSKTLCGVDPVGLNMVGTALQSISNLSGHGSANDGIVEWNSCTNGLSTSSFGTSYTSANYKASINHLDVSFRNGDGWFGDDRKQVKWFECFL
ncbi:hypothetical protein AC1031_004948 [Aphanomyces cochlioides]|nr:hypothetical protein AC1031_004948 [Aphanomyces cochlioides]